MALTGRGVAVSVSAVALFLAAELAGYAVFRVLAGALALLVLAALASVIRRDDIRVTCSARRERTRRGDSVDVRVTVHAERRFAGGVALCLPGNEEVPLPAIAAGDTVEVTCAVTAVRRGRLRIGPAAVDRLDPCGLARRRTRVDHVRELVVHPRVWPFDVTGTARRHAHDGVVVVTTRHGSVEPVGIREYAPGDSRRHVHWRASARTRRLMVRELVDPVERSFTVLLDTRPSRLDADRFEEAVDVAASLLVGHAGPATLRTTGGFTATSGPDGLLNLLTDVTQTDREPGPVSGGGRLVMVTGGLTDADVVALRRFRDVVVLDFGSGVRPRGVRVLRVSDAENAAAVWRAALR